MSVWRDIEEVETRICAGWCVERLPLRKAV